VILLVLFGVLTLAFRTVRGVLLPVVTIGLAQLWTLALVGHLDRPLNAVTVMVPLLLVILGLVYSVHVISAYYDELRARPSGDPPVLMLRALGRTALPMGLAALTTAISLLATLATPVRAMREFGWLSLAGILVAYAAAVIVTPALLLAFGRPRGLGKGVTPPPPDAFARCQAASINSSCSSPRPTSKSPPIPVLVSGSSSALGSSPLAARCRSFTQSAIERVPPTSGCCSSQRCRDSSSRSCVGWASASR